MSIDKKAFGLSDSLVDAVNEALKGGQVKLDKNHNGKLDSQDFKMLRKEDAKPDYLDFDKDGNKKEPMKKALQDKETKSEQTEVDYKKANFKHDMMGDDKRMKNEVADGNKANFKSNMKEETEVAEAAPAPKMNVAADMEARKAEVQRKIAQKQASYQQSKANKRISGQVRENDKSGKCSCGSTNESKMKCEVHGGKKGLKGGKEPIEMNPPLREASNLPKKVIKKGHEIAKSLIRHRSNVKEPYAVGMATAKKSAGIKD